MGFNVKVVGDGLAVLAALTTRRYDLMCVARYRFRSTLNDGADSIVDLSD